MLVSIVVPLYNEKEVIDLFYNRLCKVAQDLPCSVEILFINDGSTDGTLEIILGYARKDKRVKVIDFSRNFGHQNAITAGMDFANGEAIVVMDGDLQDPPELIPRMLDQYQEGFDVIFATRQERKGESSFKRITAAAFYWMLRKMTTVDIPGNTGDFRLMSRQVADAFLRMREQHRFIRGMSSWIGFKQTQIFFERDPRAAGKSKFTPTKMIRFAFDSIFSFSAKPLRLVTWIGCVNLVVGSVYLIYNLYLHFVKDLTIPGWTSLITLQICFSGALMIALGVLGEYVARIFEEIKQRPLYIVRETANITRSRTIKRIVPANPEIPETDRMRVPEIQNEDDPGN